MDMYKINGILNGLENKKENPKGESVVLTEADKKGKKPEWLTKAEEKAESKDKDKTKKETKESTFNEKEFAEELAEAFVRNHYSSNENDADVRLTEIREEIIELVQDAESILRSNPEFRSAYARAKGYWIAHILSAAGSEDYRSGSATNMQETINEISELGTPEEDQEHTGY